MIISIVILLTLFTFAFLDIGAYSSKNDSGSVISAYSSSNATGPLSGDIILYVSPEDALNAGLKEELVRAFENIGYSVTLTNELKDDYGSQFMFVNISDTNIMYTPVYSSSDIKVRSGFSSSGKTQYLDVEGLEEGRTVVFSSNGTDGYQLLIRGEITFRDETKGLFTYRSYQHHLAGDIARSVAQALDPYIKDGL